MKKIFCFVLALLLLVSIVGCDEKESPVSTSDPEHIENETPASASDFEYVENENGGITITKYIGSSFDVIIPSRIEEKNVTVIGDYAFAEKRDLLSVKIPDTVTQIGTLAFWNCTSLTTVYLSKHTETIISSFNGCTSLAEISLPSSLKTIGVATFKDCKELKSIIIPKSVTFLGAEAFMLSGIETIIFEDDIMLESIPANAFVMTNIKEIIIPASVKSVGNQAIAGCAELVSITLNDGLVTIGHCAFASNPKIEEIIIPATVENITDFAFSGCASLKKVIFEGDAPSEYLSEYIFEPANVQYTIYYYSDEQGFSQPTWNGYKTEKLN